MKCLRCRLALTEKDGEGATICRWCRIPATSLPASTKEPSGVESTATERFVPTRFTETRASVAEVPFLQGGGVVSTPSPSAVIARPSAPPHSWEPLYPLLLTPERAAKLSAIMLLQITNFTDVDHIEIRADSVALVLQ